MVDQEKLESIFATVLPLSSDERKTYLDDACGGDAELRERVDALLKASEAAGSFFDKPPAAFMPTIATGQGDTVDEAAGEISLDFLAPSNKPNCLGTLGQYEVIEVVGRGGMGLVLRAHDTKLDRVVAVKVMAPELAANPMAVKRFLREARAAAAVSHDHVVSIFAVHDDNNPPYIVMEFVDGQSLQETIDRHGSLDVKEILRIGMQIARGLSAAHEQGLVHPDIKPANILLENGVERVKLTDFGLARATDDVSVTQTGQIAGTPQFMSPEQAQGHTLDARSDLFSLGSLLYTMCTGRPPFRAETAVAMLRRVTDDDPRPVHEVNAEMPDWLEAIIFKLLAKDPEERFQSAEEVAGLLSRHLAHLQHPDSSPRPAPVGRLVSRTGETAEKTLASVARILRAAALLSQMAGLVTVFALISKLLAEVSTSPAGWVFIIGGLVSLPLSLVIEIGSGLAAKRMSYRWVMAAAILALLPVNPCAIVLLPLTTWALFGLCGQDVKSLFNAESQIARKQQPIGKSIPNLGIANPSRFRISLMVTAAAMFIALGVVIYIQTDTGTVRILVEDPDAKVVLRCDDGHRLIDIKDYDITIGLRSGENSLHIKHGDLEFATDKFSVRRGDNVVVRVSRVEGNLEVRAGEVVIGRRQLPLEDASGAPPPGVASDELRGKLDELIAAAKAASTDAEWDNVLAKHAPLFNLKEEGGSEQFGEAEMASLRRGGRTLIELLAGLPDESLNALTATGYLKWRFNQLDEPRRNAMQTALTRIFEASSRMGFPAGLTKRTSEMLANGDVGFAVVKTSGADALVWYSLIPDAPIPMLFPILGVRDDAEPRVLSRSVYKQLGELEDRPYSILPESLPLGRMPIRPRTCSPRFARSTSTGNWFAKSSWPQIASGLRPVTSKDV